MMFNSFNDAYFQILKDVWFHGKEYSPRGMKTRELLAYSFSIADPEKNIISHDGFATNVAYAKAELDWYYSGSNKLSDLKGFGGTWLPFSDDGIHVNSAYGHRIFGKHRRIKVNQWEWIKEKLKSDPDSRQCVINLNEAFDKEKPTKDFVCTVYLQVFIRNDELHWITNIRSTDVFLGIRNDVYCFTEMQKRLAAELNVGVGEYHQFCGSIHLYEAQYKKTQRLLEE